MRLFFIVLLTSCFMLTVFPLHTHALEDISAKNAIMIESKSGRIIFEKEAYEQKPIASITKIMTALLAIEEGELTDEVIISKNATETYGSAIYLKEKEKWSLEDLLYGLMLRSGNDAAIAIAEHIGASEEGFVFMMNEKAKKLGMHDTNFVNAHGLYDEAHFSTAYDMAILMQEAIKHETFQKISSTKQYKAKNHPYPWRNKNKLLTSLYKYSTGGKTGFTKKSGRTFVSTASKKDVTYIAVTLDAPDDWNDHIAMYEQAFKTYDLFILAKQGPITFKHDNKKIRANIAHHYYYPLEKKEKDKLYQKIIYKEEDKVKALLLYMLDDKQIQAIPLEIEEKENQSIIKKWLLKLKEKMGSRLHG